MLEVSEGGGKNANYNATLLSSDNFSSYAESSLGYCFCHKHRIGKE